MDDDSGTAALVDDSGASPAMDDFGTAALMEDPEGYYPPSPPPTKQVFTMQGSGRAVTLHLVGHSATEAHHVWNGAKFVADFFQEEPARVRGKAVLELGAGAGLPSLAAALLGARAVVMTDFPDPDLVANMAKNIDACDDAAAAGVVDALGFVWGADARPLLARLAARDGAGGAGGAGPRFDVLVLADLLFRHAEHGALVKTVCETMARPDGAAYVFFTSYRPWKADLDMGFFDVARAAGLAVEQVAERRLERPLFDGDPGDVEVQKTVKGFVVRWAEGEERGAAGAPAA